MKINIGKIIKSYIKDRIKIVGLVCVFAVIPVAVSALYLESEAPAVYSLILYALILVTAGVVDFYRYYRQWTAICRNLEVEELYEISGISAESELDKMYLLLTEKVIREKSELASKTMVSVTELKDYYAQWAHQIKTPIAAANLLLQAATQEKFVRELKHELFKIDFYVDAVMNYLRLEDLSSDLNYENCVLETVVKKSVKRFSTQFIAKNISVKLENLDVVVCTDGKWLGFILEQLLSNAVKYTDFGGRISVCGCSDPVKNRRIIVVKDSGIGIKSEDLPRIMERGYTGYNGRMDKKSSGIGLYLCKKAADKIGAEIRIESKVGIGTMVFVTLSGEDRGNITNL